MAMQTFKRGAQVAAPSLRPVLCCMACTIDSSAQSSLNYIFAEHACAEHCRTLSRRVSFQREARAQTRDNILRERNILSLLRPPSHTRELEPLPRYTLVNHSNLYILSYVLTN